MSPGGRSIALKAYYSPEGRCIHYAAACLQKDKVGATFANVDNVIGRVTACWVFFYPAGPNRRLLELVLKRYAPTFDCDNDVLFLCINRPGKGGTSSSRGGGELVEKEYVETTCHDILAIMDYYQVRRASLFYMCAGSSFAYLFASKYPDRTTGHMIGVSSWILRSTSSSDGEQEENEVKQPPQMHSLSHRLAMNGFLGPKWFVSSIASGSMNNMNGLLGILPAPFLVDQFKKALSKHEQLDFATLYVDRDGAAFVDDLLWMNDDGEGNGSEFINLKHGENDYPCHNDGNSKDIAVCLTTQEDLGLIYNKTITDREQVLLWHGTNDRMISVEGSAYLASSLPNAKLHKVDEGTHQGTMFFFPGGVMVALNMISCEVYEP